MNLFGSLLGKIRGTVRFSGILLWVTGGLVNAALAASTDFPPCPPPAASEYLLLIRGDSEEQRDRVQQLLPLNTTILVCSYLNDPVVRAGGFPSLEMANAWAQYMTEVEGLQAFVARPAVPQAASTETETSANPAPANPAPANSPATDSTETGLPAYNPQPLAAGFAVLVDYYNHPEVALDVQQLLGRAVGLVVYRQQPYLLAAQSPDATAASETLRQLNDYDFTSIMVDSRQVVLLTSTVATPNQFNP